MADPVVHVGAQIQCFHTSGQISVASSNVRVKVSGMAVATLADVYTVAGCLFQVSGAASPCLTATWQTPALRVRVLGSPAILKTSAGDGRNAALASQGLLKVLVTQPRVKGT